MMHFLGMVVGPGLGGVLAGAFNIAVPFFVCGALAFASTVLVAFTVQETIPTENSMDASSTGLSSSSETSLRAPTISNFKVAGQLTPYVGIFLGLCVARLILALSNSLIQPVLSVYANEQLGVNEVGVGMLFTVQAIAILFTTLPMGAFADRIGRKPMIVFGKIFQATSAILVIFSGSFWPLLLIMMLRGFGRGVSNPSIVAIFSGLVPGSKRGRAMGIFSIFQNIGLVIGSTLGGFFYDFYSSEIPFVACATIGFIGVFVVLLTVSEPKQDLT